ncbi:MAG: sulfotransferase family protein, partial [Mycobacterium sp.]
MGDLSAAAIIATAQETTGLSDFGGDDWREALDVLTESLRTEAGLTEFGEVVAQADVVGSLTRRLQVVEYRRAHPELADSPIERPIFI